MEGDRGRRGGESAASPPRRMALCCPLPTPLRATQANPLFPRVKHALTAKASLAYAMRAQQLREGMTMFEDAPSDEKAR